MAVDVLFVTVVTNANSNGEGKDTVKMIVETIVAAPKKVVSLRTQLRTFLVVP